LVILYDASYVAVVQKSFGLNTEIT